MASPILGVGLLLSDQDKTLLKATPVSELSPAALTPVSSTISSRSPIIVPPMLADLRDFLLIMMSDNLFMARIASTHRAHFLLAWNCFSFSFN